jgi:cytidine deaminase
MDDRDLFALALKAKRNAYAPYSGFKVGAALVGKSGKVYAGCNVENASYGLTICAERNALFQGVVRGERTFVKLALVIEGLEPALPCGACLQVLSEFGKDLEIVSRNTKGKTARTKLSELLPRAFRLDRKKNSKGPR